MESKQPPGLAGEYQSQNLPTLEGPDSGDATLTPLNVIRTETVLSKLPVHNLAKKGMVNIQIVKHGPHGDVELKWEVSYSDRYGQARQLAYKLDTIVIDKHVEEAGRPLPERLCLGSLRDIADQLGLGGDTNKVRRALRQNASAFITAKFKYRANDGTERTVEADFTRYSVICTGEKFPDGSKADAVYILLNAPYREVLNNAPVRPLNLDYKKQLPPAAQRFYEIVSYKIFTALKYNQPVARLPYSEYCTFSAQQRYFEREQFRKQMYKVHQPHIQSGYILKQPQFEETTDDAGNRDWLMLYAPGPKARVEFETFTGKRPRTLEHKTAPAQFSRAGESVPALYTRRPRQKPLPLHSDVGEQALLELTSRGVGESQARKVLSDLPADFPLLATLEWGEQQVRNGNITNPPGFYISLLRDRQKPPSTFQSSAARNAQQQAVLREQQALQEATAREIEQEHTRQQEANAELDELQATDPDRYRTLHDEAKAQLYAEFPRMAQLTAHRPDSALHEGPIRARMRELLKEFPHHATNEPARQSDLLEELQPAAAAFAETLHSVLNTPQLVEAPKPQPTAKQLDKDDNVHLL